MTATTRNATKENELSQISDAIAARQTQITELQNDIEALHRAAGIMAGGKTAPAKTAPTAKPRATTTPKPQSKKPRAGWSAARLALMKAYWAKRKKATAAAAAPAAQPKAAKKRKPMSAAAKKALSKRMKASWKRRKAKG